MNNGWIKLHRKIQDHPLYYAEPLTKMGAWIDMLLLANHAPKTIYVRGNEVVINRGQFAYSEMTLSAKWGWSRNKLRRFLNRLETIQQIEQQKNSILSLYTVINYDEYQGDGTENDTTDDTTERQQKNINKNDKNIISKDITEVSTSDVFAPKRVFGRKDVNTLLGAVSKMTPTGKLDGSEKENRRLATTIIKKYTLETALKALRNIKGSFYEGKINSARDLFNHFNALLNAKADTRRTDITDLVSSSFKKL